MPFGDDDSSPPPAPQPYYVAQEQSAFNEEAAKKSRELSTYDYSGPGYERRYEPTGEGDRMRIVDSLTEPSKSIYDKGQQAQLSLANFMQGLSGRVGEALDKPAAFDAPGIASRVSQLDLAGAPTIRGVDDFSGDRQRIEDMVYGAATRRLDPQFAQTQDKLETQLAARGITPGSEAYEREQQRFANQRTDAYADARDRAIQAGGAEQSRLFGLEGTARQQYLNEALNAANFQNTARQAQAQEQEYQRGADLNYLNSLLRGNAIQTPQIASGPAVSMQAPNYAGLVQQGYQNQLAQSQAAQGQQDAMMGSLFGLGGSVAGSIFGGPAGGAAGGAAGRALGGLF